MREAVVGARYRFISIYIEQELEKRGILQGN
jgi:hypothetical protein